MAFTQNIVAERRRCVHSRARGHGRAVRARRVAVEYPSPSSRCDRTKCDPAVDRHRLAIAEPHANIRGCRRRFSQRDSSSECDGASQGAADRSSRADRNRDPPDAAADHHATADRDPDGGSHADADRESDDVSVAAPTPPSLAGEGG